MIRTYTAQTEKGPVDFVLNEAIQFVCPFCKKRASVFEQGSEQEGNMEIGLLHEKPMCEKFERMEPDDYLHEVNKQFGLHN